MARLSTGGFEIDVAHASPDATGPPTGTVTLNTTTKRSGNSSGKYDSTGANAAAFTGIRRADLSVAPLIASQTAFIRAYMNFANAPGSTTRVMKARGGASSAQGVSVRLTSGGKLQLWNDVAGTQIGSDSATTLVMDGTVWYRIELKSVADASNNTTDCELQLDGVSVASISATSISGVSAGPIFGWLTAPGANKVLYIDDIAVNDSTGAANNTWPGAGKVVLLAAISDNARVGWTNAAGGTTNLFDDVDNIPPVGVASPSTQPAQIKRNAANTTDTYDANLTTYTTAGLASGDTLNAIHIFFNIGYSFAAVASEGLQMLSNPVIAEFTTSTDGSAAGSYNSHWTWGGKAVDYSGTVSSNVTVDTSPVLRVRKNTSSSSRQQFCDFMGAYVDYTPASLAEQILEHLDAVNRSSVW